MQVNIHWEWKQYDASLILGCLESDVHIKKKDEQLWEKLETFIAKQRQKLNKDEIAQQPNIAAARQAYKAIGQDPARYRPSAEALMRRIVQGKPLYQINNVVDLLNYVALYSGISIGGYDADKIQGNALMGIGKIDEPYEAIGRGQYNIANLPVLRDEQGAFGSPTSDSARTAITTDTTHILLVFFAFSGTSRLEEMLEWCSGLLIEHAHAINPVINKAGL